jgi:hypothetical protein
VAPLYSDGKLLLDRQVLIPKIVIRQTLSEAIAGWLFQAQGEMTAGPLGILLDVLRPCIVKRKNKVISVTTADLVTHVR